MFSCSINRRLVSLEEKKPHEIGFYLGKDGTTEKTIQAIVNDITQTQF